VQHANLLDRDIVGAAQVQTSPGHVSDVKIGFASLRVPLYPLGLMLETTAVHSSVDSGTVKTSAGDYLLSSRGDSFSLRLTRLLPRWGAVDHRVSIGQDWRRVDSTAVLASSATCPRVGAALNQSFRSRARGLVPTRTTPSSAPPPGSLPPWAPGR